MALNWYLKKEYFDSRDDIEAVFIYYTCTPLGQEPDWSQAEARLMPAGEYLKAGVGEVAKYGPPAPFVPQTIHPRLRKKVLKMPNEVYDPALGAYTSNYLLYYYYEVVINGERQATPVITEEIASRDVVVSEPLGVAGGFCVNWSVYDWDAPQFSPTEDPAFVEMYGEDHPLRQHKFYGTEGREAFGVAKKALVDTLPLPRRFTARIAAPVGATIRLRLHVGNWGLPEFQRWEDYWLDEAFVMEQNAAPLELTPLGTEPAPAPLSTVAPELLIGNPYLPLILDRHKVEATIIQEAEAIVAASDVLASDVPTAEAAAEREIVPVI